MNPATTVPPRLPIGELPDIATDLPVLFEDEGQEEMGETLPHTAAINVLANGLAAHFSRRPELTVLSDMNLYYHPTRRWAYVSPDVMVVRPPAPLPDSLRSYRIGQTGPAPTLAIEVLSRRSFQQQDLTNKPVIYAELGVAEYILVDPTGEFLPERLLLKRLRNDQTWEDEQDADGGVTSDFGFRVVFEADDQVRVLAATGEPYPRPVEAYLKAQAETEARAAAEAARAAAESRVHDLEAELARLRGGPTLKPNS
jgi:Uma2 family endonuclease